MRGELVQAAQQRQIIDVWFAACTGIYEVEEAYRINKSHDHHCLK